MKLNKIFIALVVNILVISNIYASYDCTEGILSNQCKINPEVSTVEVDMNEVSVNGIAGAKITVHLVNYDGNNVNEVNQIELRTISSLNPDVIISEVNHHSNSQGEYSFIVKSQVSQEVSFYVHVKEIHNNGESESNIKDINVTFLPPSLPNGLILEGGQVAYVTSIYDKDYIPYTRPVSKAEFKRPIMVDGVFDKMINIQGEITQQGIRVDIPYNANYDVVLPMYKGAYTVPAIYTEDNRSRRIYLEYSRQLLHAGNGVIHARVYSPYGALLTKKLDINVGIGDGSETILANSNTEEKKSAYGVFMAKFKIAIDADGGYGETQLRAIAAIPDRKFNQAGHKFVYLPIQSNNKTWLNNNLGADYTNLEHSEFDLTKQANHPKDEHAYGSFFNLDVSYLNTTCPIGYRLPTRNELENERKSWNIPNKMGAIHSPLRLSLAGHWERQIHQKEPKSPEFCNDNQKFRKKPKGTGYKSKKVCKTRFTYKKIRYKIGKKCKWVCKNKWKRRGTRWHRKRKKVCKKRFAYKWKKIKHKECMIKTIIHKCSKNRKMVAYYLGKNNTDLAFNHIGSATEIATSSEEYSVRCIKD